MSHLITCGNRAAHDGTTAQHATTASVRACYDPSVETFACGWLIEVTTEVGDDEWGYEPYTRIVDCGALAFATDRGWHCEAGHDYVTAEVRHAERWDYASDEEEARQLRKYGVDAVAMNGGSI